MDKTIKIQIEPKHITFLNQIFEAYDGLALVTTISAQKGLVEIHTTSYTENDVLGILKKFPKNIIII